MLVIIHSSPLHPSGVNPDVCLTKLHGHLDYHGKVEISSKV